MKESSTQKKPIIPSDPSGLSFSFPSPWFCLHLEFQHYLAWHKRGCSPLATRFGSTATFERNAWLCSLSRFCSRLCCFLYRYRRYLFISLRLARRQRWAMYLKKEASNRNSIKAQEWFLRGWTNTESQPGACEWRPRVDDYDDDEYPLDDFGVTSSRLWGIRGRRERRSRMVARAFLPHPFHLSLLRFRELRRDHDQAKVDHEKWTDLQTNIS